MVNVKGPTPSVTSATERARAAARDIGFHGFGVASAKGVLSLAERLGLAGFRRFDLRTALPGAKSAISVSLSYLKPEELSAFSLQPSAIRNSECGMRNQSFNPQPSTFNPEFGLVARFARGLDYHSVLESRLEKLAERLADELGEFRYRICVDTGPISDRVATYAAGLGSFGRNACLITPEYGSWVVLGELITDLDLEHDEPRELEVCGDCRLCVEACPTGALRGDFTMNRAKCLSNVTQKKGDTPPELAARLGGRIYGCDVCQEVCPLNAGAKFTDATEFLTQNPVGAFPELAKLAAITDKEFDQLFGGTAMRWVGRETIARNAAKALRSRT